MYLSCHLKIDQQVLFKKVQLMKVKQNRKLKNYYLLCTSPKAGALFEIIPGDQLSDKYSECYLVGISKEKEWLVQYILELVDKLYNTTEIEYPMLKVE